MKKTFIMAFVLAAVIGLAFAGSAFAQDGNPPLDGEKDPRDGSGLLHDYMSEAMANALGVTVEELQAGHDAGENFFDLALAQGITEEEIPTLMQSARDAALEAAIADGAITQEEVDQMQTRGGKGGGLGERDNCDGSGEGAGQFEGGRGGLGQNSAG
ncbi:MAG: hypothetical protein HN736_16070 [Anaerolineae bacterium]|nr:hypothetical protein [Anaerolineae bacterium]MBT4312598.1 hypothetical protein [Anaerolineae bacterium]MBT4456728.1 hypothetical protein [Anaerolineae bacterium]MBT4841524.1 hypothetical protein [Anaerolineae bacterium]MBT6060916.1 hypothetical protein [Anaerolineae bacterium]